MKLSRRSLFGKTAGALVAVVAAPLFIPAERLEFGVPRALALPTREELLPQAIGALARDVATPSALPTSDSVPMLLVNNEFMVEYGGRLEAGSTVLVDRATAGRWLDYGVAVPAAGYDVQPDTTRRALEAAAAAQDRAERYGLVADPLPPMSEPTLLDLIAQARQRRDAASLDAATVALRAWLTGGEDRADLVLSPDLGPSRAPVLATKPSTNCVFGDRV